MAPYILTELNYTHRNMKETKNEDLKETKDETSKSNGKYILIVFLILAVCGSVGYIGYDKFQEKSLENDLEIFQEGMQYASNQIALDIFNEAITCTPIPLNNGSIELNLIAAECLTATPPAQ